MTDRTAIDHAEQALHHIRRITRMDDLDQLIAIIHSRRCELAVRNTRRDYKPRPGSQAVAKNSAKKHDPVKQTMSTLDPSHKTDPVFIEYKVAERELASAMRDLKVVERSKVTGPVKIRFDAALAAWLTIKLRYKKMDEKGRRKFASSSPQMDEDKSSP